jgi:transposase
MAVALLPDPLWDLVEPILPTPPRRPKGGRPRVSDRACLTGIVFVLRSGVPWQMLPQELGCGSGMTCWRRLRDWQQAGVWDLIHFALLDWLARDDQIDWSRAVVDSCSIRAVYGGDQTGPNPTERAKRGSKRHLLCDGRGVPLAVRLTGANRNDSQGALALVDAIPPLQGARGRPRQRPDCVLGDRGYDAAAIRRGLRTRHIVSLLAMRRTEHGSGLGRWRWVVERTFAWLSQFRRLWVRYDKRADIHEARSSRRVRADLLAIAAQDMENRMRPMPSFPGVHRPGRCSSSEIASCGCLGLRGQALDISKRYAVDEDLSVLTSASPL